jgi:hypothetical protein
MIHIAGAHTCTFPFPAPLPLAYDYYSQVERLLGYLPHISIDTHFSQSRYRLEYHSFELGLYQVQMFCDVEVVLNSIQTRLEILPIKNMNWPVRPSASLYGLTGMGEYASSSTFSAQGAGSQIEFNMRLSADLPAPLGLRLMPGSLITRIAKGIVERRIREIADGFIERSIREYTR